MRRFLSAAAALAVVLSGCGTTGSTGVDAEPTLAIGPPDATQAGIYLATARGYDEAEGLDLELRRSGNGAKLLRSGQADAAVVDIDEVGGDVVGVMAVVQRPLSLVLAVTRSALEDDRAEVAAMIRALQRGYVEAASDPPSAVTAMLEEVPTLERDRLTAELEAVAPSFTAGAPVYGHLDRKRLEAWARRAHRPNAIQAFDTTLVGPISRD